MAAELPKHHRATRNEKLVIAASSLGTVFEWYDFYLYGLLAGLSRRSSSPASTRPPGSSSRWRPLPRALRCGRSARWCSAGSAIWSGAKTPFSSRWGSWDCRPSWSACCPAMPASGSPRRSSLVLMRLLQGLALGGEYGGAATYVAEHAPNNKPRLVHQLDPDHRDARAVRGAADRDRHCAPGWARKRSGDWGWRVPFLVSIVLLGVSLWIRLQLNESPVFQKMKDEGTTSKAPLTEAFGQWSNLRKLLLVALFGAVAGQAVVWYTGQFYALFFSGKDAQGRWPDRQHADRHRAGDSVRRSSSSSAGSRTRSGASRSS